MVKKSLIAGLTAIILSLCCGLCFAADNDKHNTINLGNEITQSLDKAGQSVQNVTNDMFSGNLVNDASNGMKTMTNDVKNGVNIVDNGIVNTTKMNTNTNTNNNAGNYNATRTTAEGATRNITTMSTTTWMWMILAVAAIIIVAAIWYYATQSND